MAEYIELHGYCDSSEQAYCAVIYIHAPSRDGSTSESRIVTLIVPIQKTSIPRLELLSCVLLAELMGNTMKVLKVLPI